MARPIVFLSLLRSATPALVALMLTGLLAVFGALAPLDRGWFDFLQRKLAPQAPVPADTAIVLIDEQSLRAMGADPYDMRWPWPRGAFAALFAGLHKAGAKRVVADLLFLENSDAAEQDALLGAVAAGLPEVTLGAVPGRVPVVWPADFRHTHPALFSRRPRWGMVKSIPDADGVIRRYLQGGSLAEAALDRADARPTPAPAWLRWRGNLQTLRARGVALLPAAPFVAAGLTLLDRATETAPDLDPDKLARAIDAQPALPGDVFSKVRGRIVFIGANAAGTFDSVATPVGAPEPGVISHWTALANFEADDFLLDTGPWAVAVLLASVIVFIAWIGRAGVGLRNPGLAAAASIVLAAGGSAGAFAFGRWLPPAVPTAGAAAAFTAVAVESFRRERARKREIQQWFGAYVSPAVVKRLIRDPESLRLGGERRELTIYFSDLAGFTTLSENLPPDRLVQLVNTFLEALSACIFDHDGYLDKYIGDAIMGVFGSPEPLENHALAACRAALASQRRLAILNDQLEREHGVRLGMRIGINTGDAVVGNVGSERKKNYTVLGDAVNLASRLEGANKEFGTSILIGPATAAHLNGKLVIRPVARLQVKGKNRAVDVFELLGDPAESDAETLQFVDRYTAGFAAFCERRFAEAADLFETAAGLRPDDRLTTLYLADARRFVAEEPEIDWEPTLHLKTK